MSTAAGYLARHARGVTAFMIRAVTANIREVSRAACPGDRRARNSTPPARMRVGLLRSLRFGGSRLRVRALRNKLSELSRQSDAPRENVKTVNFPSGKSNSLGRNAPGLLRGGSLGPAPRAKNPPSASNARRARL